MIAPHHNQEVGKYDETPLIRPGDKDRGCQIVSEALPSAELKAIGKG